MGMDSNARSIKTRIETKYPNRAGATAEDSNARSIKTRIETMRWEADLRGIEIIRMQDPLKQGLKPDLPENISVNEFVFECKIH